MASWVYAYVQTHQTVHIKYMRFFVHQLDLSKVVKGIIKLRVSHQPPLKKEQQNKQTEGTGIPDTTQHHISPGLLTI